MALVVRGPHAIKGMVSGVKEGRCSPFIKRGFTGEGHKNVDSYCARINPRPGQLFRWAQQIGVSADVRAQAHAREPAPVL